MPKLSTIALLAAALYAGMLIQQSILTAHGYSIKFSGLGKPDG
jgi:hypothetical protein